MIAKSRKRRCWNIATAREKFAAQGLDLLEPAYHSVHTPMAYRCRSCSHKGKLRLKDIQCKKCGCKVCGITCRSKARRLDFEIFKMQQLDRGFEILSGEYLNTETKLKVRHKMCGYEWMVRPHCLQAGRGCPRCHRTKQSARQLYSIDHVVNELAKRGITLLSDYSGAQKPITVKFNSCGHVVERTYNQLSRWPKCGICAPNARATEKDYFAIANEFNGTILKIASSVHRRSIWRCELGHKFERSLASIKKCHSFCTECNGAYGEILCRKVTETLFGVPFQKTRIPQMKSPKGHALELDIYNDKLRIAVEHHGAHHYRAVPHWNGIEGLKRQRLHDLLRRQFCKAKGILLVEIRELGIRTSVEDVREQIRAALINNGRRVPICFDKADLGSLPQLNTSQVYWKEIHQAAQNLELEILSQSFQGAEMPISIRCKRGHVTQKTPRSILQGHRCDECYMEKRRKPVRLSDGRVFESRTAAAKKLGVRKETVNTAIRRHWKVQGLEIQRISTEEFFKYL